MDSFSWAAADCLSAMSMHIASTMTKPAYVPFIPLRAAHAEIGLGPGCRSMSGPASEYWFINESHHGVCYVDEGKHMLRRRWKPVTQDFEEEVLFKSPHSMAPHVALPDQGLMRGSD